MPTDDVPDKDRVAGIVKTGGWAAKYPAEGMENPLGGGYVYIVFEKAGMKGIT
jgi:hypothetical protein